MAHVSLKPNNCTCPGQTYTCQANGVIRMEWESDAFPGGDPVDYSLLDIDEKSKAEIEIEQDDLFQVKFTRSMVVEGFANISSTLLITNLTALNGTDITCEISAGVDNYDNNTLTVCIIGKSLLTYSIRTHVNLHS